MYRSLSRSEDLEANIFLKAESAVRSPHMDLGARVEPDGEIVTGIIRYDDPNIGMLASLSKKIEVVQPLAEKDGTSFIYRMYLNHNPSALAQDIAAEEPTFWLLSENTDAKRQMQEGIKKGVRYFISSPFRELRRGRAFLPITVKECWWGPETTEGTAYGLQTKP